MVFSHDDQTEANLAAQRLWRNGVPAEVARTDEVDGYVVLVAQKHVLRAQILIGSLNGRN